MSSELLGATTPWQCLHKKLGEARTEEQVTYGLTRLNRSYVQRLQ